MSQFSLKWEQRYFTWSVDQETEAEQKNSTSKQVKKVGAKGATPQTTATSGGMQQVPYQQTSKTDSSGRTTPSGLPSMALDVVW